jgi:hypothetical protein
MGTMAELRRKRELKSGEFTTDYARSPSTSGRTFWDYGPGINELEWNLQTTGVVLERGRVVSECRLTRTR